MTLDESAVTELLAAIKPGEGTDLVRTLAQWVLQELIEAEAEAAIGAGRWERTEGRVAERNGHRMRTLSTKAGDLTIGIPKLRAGTFTTTVLEPRRRIDQALYAVVMEAYVHGVSTRKVDDLVTSMGIDTGIPLAATSDFDRPACQCCRISTTSITSNALLANSLLLIDWMRTSTYSDKEPGPRTPALTTTDLAVEYLNADPVDYLNESAPTRWIP